MDDVKRTLAARRRFLASQSRLTLDSHKNFHSQMTDFNSKVDLRPQWMINDNNAQTGKPHVDAVLQPQQRATGIPRGIPRLSPDQLKGVVLRKTGTRSSIDSEGTRTKEDIQSSIVMNHSQTISKDIGMNSNDNTSDTGHSNYTAVPMPPPIPNFNQFPQQSKPIHKERTFDSPKYQSYNREMYNGLDVSELLQKENELNSLKEKFNKLEQSLKDHGIESSQAPRPNLQVRRDYNNYNPVNDVRNSNHFPKRPSVDSGVEFSPTFDERELRNENMNKWMEQLINDKFERLSRIDTVNDDKPEPPPDRSRSGKKSNNSDKDRTKQGRSSSRKSRRAISPTRSEVSSKGSIKSVAKSIKSVLFKSTEEAEILSEVDDDDVADLNAGQTDFVDLTSRKFTIHGPFVDKELNVFHAICKEYQKAATISFAKRTPFARTNPAHERVYALIGSNKRTGWTNRNNWSDATNDLQVLDYIFRKIIRSNSRRIRKPVMELEHFTEGALLDTRRFWKIMKAVFKKREHLTQVLNTTVENFDDIK